MALMISTKSRHLWDLPPCASDTSYAQEDTHAKCVSNRQKKAVAACMIQSAAADDVDGQEGAQHLGVMSKEQVVKSETLSTSNHICTQIRMKEQKK